MADYRKSKSNTSSSSKEERIKLKPRDRHDKDDYKNTNMEPKTPPLPTRRSSIEDLVKQRDTIKRELKKFAKRSERDLSADEYEPDKNSNNSKSDYVNESHSRKRFSGNYENAHKVKKKPDIEDSIPDGSEDYMQVESEDEECIIEKRRQQRKKLLEKFNLKHQEIKTGNNSNKHNDSLLNNDTNQKSLIDNKATFANETADMFSDKDDFAPKPIGDLVTQDNSEINSQQLTGNWDDDEGYYNVKLGDVINNGRYMIKSILGKGVFANVVRAQDRHHIDIDVAIKIVRNNELMYKTSLKEVEILKQLTETDPDNKYHCVKYLTHFMHKGHLCLVLEPLCMDLRSIIKKYGKHHGINMKALASYSRQLLVALRLLKKIGIVHADIKPDNILVNEKKNVLKLCDFGSATKVDDNEHTPYLVSRFYRAPEIILGIPFKHSVDIWSTACTIFEMATAKIMFAGSSNNKMLKCFMDLKGRFSAKLIRKGRFKDQHFNYNNNFLLHKKDEFTGREKVVEVSNINITRDLQKELKLFSKNVTVEEEKKLLQLKDILDKMLTLDPNQRLSVNDCLRHAFIQDDLRK